MSSHHPTDALAGLRPDRYARHVPAPMYVQDSGLGLVNLVGSSRIPDTGDTTLCGTAVGAATS